MKNKFSWKAFISFGLTYSFVFIIISGFILFLSPPGRYAHWVNWTFLGFTKEGWQAIHTIFSFTFTILSIFHLFTMNWKLFLGYLKSKATNGLNKKREFYFSTLLVVLFFLGTIYSIPPFKTIMVFGENLTASWEKEEELAPIPHAELLTLTELAEHMKLSSVNELTEKLTKNQIVFENTETQTLQEIAINNNTTPFEIYKKISTNTPSLKQGSGIGKKSLEEFAAEVGRTGDEAITILKTNNIVAEKNQTLRDIAAKNSVTPKEIFELISK